MADNGRANHKQAGSAYQRGASLTGYGLIVGLIAVLGIGAVGNTGQQVNSLFGSVAGELAGVGGVGGGGTTTPSASPAPSASASASDIACTGGVTVLVAASGQVNGSMSPPSGCQSVTIKLWAAGGASGRATTGSAASFGGRGGAGGYAEGSLIGLTGSEVLSWSIGAAGNTPSSASPPAEGVGGASSIGMTGGNGQTGPAQAGGGGAAGASVRLDGTSLLIAGGGGGGGSAQANADTNPRGGRGGAHTAENGVVSSGSAINNAGVYNGSICTGGTGSTAGGTGTSGGGSFGASGGGGGGICGGESRGHGIQTGGGGGAGMVDITRLVSGAFTTQRSINGSNQPTNFIPTGTEVTSALSSAGVTAANIGRGGVAPGLDQGENGQPGLLVLEWGE